jgi:anti-sigma regulatory factor (Ser/Thr protein kinase)
MGAVRLSHLSPGSFLVRFIAALSMIPHARHWVADRAREGGVALQAVRIIELLATEAITNAVIHGPPGGTIEVTVGQHGPNLRVGVRDGSDTWPVLRDPAPGTIGGRGVLLIDRLAHAWGVQAHRGGGKTVWFDVPRADRPAPGVQHN